MLSILGRNWHRCPYCGREFETMRFYLEHVRECEARAYRRDQERYRKERRDYPKKQAKP